MGFFLILPSAMSAMSLGAPGALIHHPDGRSQHPQLTKAKGLREAGASSKNRLGYFMEGVRVKALFHSFP